MGAKALAAKLGYDDVVKLLEKAEKDIPPGKYKRYGRSDNNMKLKVYESGETGSGKNPLEAFRIKDYVAGKKKTVAKPPTTCALLFPGQGSQYVKMMSVLQTKPKVKKLIEEANDVLGYNILDICLKGPEEELERTAVCQPAMF